MNQLSLLDYILIVLSVIFSWSFQFRAHPPPAEDEAAQTPMGATGHEHVADAPEPQAQLERTLQHICIAFGYEGIASFTDGARQAYEMLVQAFARGDIAPCAYLLTEPVRQVFAQAIAASAQRGESTQLTFIGIRNFEIVDAQIDRHCAWIEVKIEADMVSVTRDKAGHVIAGHHERVFGQSEVWIFERDLRATGPGWLVAGTHSA